MQLEGLSPEAEDDMAVITLKVHGDFKKTNKFLDAMMRKVYLKVLDVQGKRGVAALQSATPVDTGLTAASWDYHIEEGNGWARIVWTNSNETRDGDPIALLLQYGHGTGTGGYVQGRDYINPAVRPVFDDIARVAWEAVVNS